MRFSTGPAILCALLLVAVAPPFAAPITAQSGAAAGSDDDGPTADAPPEFLGLDLGFGVSGRASISGGVYRARGIDARRPTETWRMSFGPTLELPLGMTAGVDVMLSSDGRDYRQNINQFGISPTWGWGTAHLGDFSRDLTALTVSGQRIRGAGLDLSPGSIRASIQAGRVQRATSGADGVTYDRDLLAMRFGYGTAQGRHLELNVVKARDDESSVDDAALAPDTLLLDTIPEGLRPERASASGPQENLVAGFAGRLPLLDERLIVEGEMNGALTTRDLASPRASADEAGVPGFVDALHPVRLSTVGDLAYRLNATGRFATARVDAGYESIGPGYGSAGMAYVINDRRTYHLGGSGQLLDGRMMLQGRYQHRNNNLLEQRRATTTQDVANATVALRASETVTTTLTAMRSLVLNDAPADSGGLENRALSLTAGVSSQHELLDRSTAVTLNYGLHRMDGHAIEPIPTTTVHNVSGSVQLAVSETVSLAPSLSAVVRAVDGRDSERDLLFGFRGRARLLDGRLRTSASLSHTFRAGREMSGARASVSYPIFQGATLSFDARHTEYSAFGGRPAFGESFATVGLNTSF